MVKEDLIKINTLDLEKIALWKIYSKRSDFNKNIFFTHGTFSDRKVCLGISEYFANLEYTCWIMEWRNHGESSKTKKEFNFETIAKYDIKSVFDYLFDTLKIKEIDCITHSGGGICLTMYLIKNQKRISKINSIVIFSCQSCGACYSIKNYIKVLFSKYISSILGYIPGKIIGLGTHNESYTTMKQWFNWNLYKNFKGENGYDYLKDMELITTPILSIYTKGDKFIAPKKGCEDYLNAFNNNQNKLLYCSIENEYAENYNHSRIMLSKNSANEIWPLVFEWIANHGAK